MQLVTTIDFSNPFTDKEKGEITLHKVTFDEDFMTREIICSLTVVRSDEKRIIPIRFPHHLAYEACFPLCRLIVLQFGTSDKVGDLVEFVCITLTGRKRRY